MMPSSNDNRSQRVTVAIDPDLEELIPGFLENRRKDAAALEAAVRTQDFNMVRLLGHRMKGDGGGYGFQEISDIGGVLEEAAVRKDRTVIGQQVAALNEYLAQVEVVYRK
jgi:histidine phosphotransfer protein HptB